MSFPCLKFSSGSLVTGNKIQIIESWLKRVHFPQPKLQPHQPSFFNRLILFQVKAFVLVTLMRPSMSSCLHVHSFFQPFRPPFTCHSSERSPLSPLSKSARLSHLLFFNSALSLFSLYPDRNFFSFIYFCWPPFLDQNSLRAGIPCVL